MKRRTSDRRPASMLRFSFCFLQIRRGIAALLICFEVLQQTSSWINCALTDRRHIGLVEVAAVGSVHEQAPTPAGLKLDAMRIPNQDCTRRISIVSGRAGRRRLASAALVQGGSSAAVVLALIGGLTTVLYGSPKQAFKRLRLKARRKVPWSWSRYMRSLPAIEEANFTDFPRKWPADGRKLLVMLVKDVSAKLADFLHLGPEERKHGIAIKATLAGSRRSLESVLNEINAHMNMVPRSKFILPVLGAYRAKNGKRVYLILPRLRGNLRSVLDKSEKSVNVQLALAEMAYSVNLLHEAGFLHRDIKLLNFFVGFDGHVVLADFEGTFDKSMWTDSSSDLVIYSKGYLAPEVHTSKDWVRFTEKSDVYALGICFKYFLKHVTHVPRRAHLSRLVTNMTAKDASKRYSMKQVLQSPFFEGINFDTLELLDQGVPFPGGDGAYEDTRPFL